MDTKRVEVGGIVFDSERDDPASSIEKSRWNVEVEIPADAEVVDVQVDNRRAGGNVLVLYVRLLGAA